MTSPGNELEYETVVIGAAELVKQILRRLNFVQAIDRALGSQPAIAASYGRLAQLIVVNRLSFQPAPLYQMAEWTAQHGLAEVFGLEATWLDDDRLGALLEGIADQQVTIWSSLLEQAVKRFGVELTELHSDTTSIYFEGDYTDQPLPPGERVPLLVEGYNKDGQRHKVQLVLSLVTSGRVPLWYRPWNGNQTDEAVYLADLRAFKQALPLPGNSLLIGDRKLCTTATMISFCRQGQDFLAAHPWTDTAKAVWQETWAQLQAGQLTWQPVEYVSRNQARKALDKRPSYRVCEVAQTLPDDQTEQVYALRWVFVWSSDKAQQDARQRSKALQAGEAALQRIARLAGKYDYTDQATIETRLKQALDKAKASPYFSYQVQATAQGWQVTWQQQTQTIATTAQFDGISLLCTNVLPERLAAGEVMVKYKSQVYVEQTIDFIKSPVQIRPMWLHSPKRIAGLTLLIMVAVLVAALLEHQVRHWIARTGQVVRGLRPEGRDNPYPTAKSLLRAFQNYALVLVKHRGREEVHYPKLRPLQQQIWHILELDPLPA